MSLEGSSHAAIARVNDVSPGTVSRWLARASEYARKFTDATVRDVTPDELQADEVRTVGPSRNDRHFVFCVLAVGARLWTSSQVGRRTLRNARLLLQKTRNRCALGQPRLLITTDPFRYYRVAIQKTWGPTAVHVESGKIIRGCKIMRVRNELVLGTQWQLEAARARCTASKKINTAFIERLNLYIRRALAAMHRQTTSLVRSAASLEQRIELLQCFYNFVRPHESLRRGRESWTPAQDANLVTKRLSLRDVFMSVGPRARMSWLVNPEARVVIRRGCGATTVNG
jgi:IS1 family transposase